jgi:hypothetical protein
MKPKYFLFLCLSFLIFNSSLLIGTVRFVSKSGTSTPPYTSWLTAADSIQKCINICVDGDTVYVANGVYKENLVINTAISLLGSCMDSTVIDGTGLTSPTIYALNDLTISGFNVIGNGNTSDQNVKVITTTTFNLELSNCMIKNAYDGIFIGRSSGEIDNVIITNVNTGIFTFCGYDTCKPVIKNSVIIVRPGAGIGIENFHQGQPTIKNNIILATQYETSSGIRNVIELKKLVVENNLIAGFMLNVDVGVTYDTVKVINNLIRDYNSTNTGLGAIYGYDGTEKTMFRNNILSNNRVGIRFTGDPNSDFNLFWENDINVINGTALGDYDIFADPMFVKDTLAYTQTWDFHLQKYSPAIDAGDPSILDVDGSRSDIGLFGGPLGESYTYQDLAPKPPGNLTASMDSGLVHLKWNKNTEADLFRYRVYRDTVPDFIYDTTKIIAVLSDTTFYDDPPQKFISGNYYYKVTAIDSAYHQSPASEEAHINITGIPEAPPIVVEHYNLLQNYPNPFNPSTTIPYRLRAPGYVKVMVYNLLGEQVKVLVNKYQSAGYYEVLFHPTATERQSAEGKIEFETGYGDIVSGIYLYRIEVIGEGNIPVFTDMKKMLMIK